MTDETPRLATLDDDGWTLINAEDRLAAGDRLYWMPDRWEREHLDEHVPDGGCVKLMFCMRDPEHPDAPVTERMWVTLGGIHGEWYHGHLTNVPHTAGSAHEHMPVWYRAEHVIDYIGPDGSGRASEREELLHCGTHGVSAAYYLCAHLDPQSEGRGFNFALNTDQERPDAWCDTCDRLLDGVDGWDDLGENHPQIQIVCAGCYDLLRARHARGST